MTQSSRPSIPEAGSNFLSVGAEGNVLQTSLPTMYDLPSEFPEEPGLPDEYHDLQPQLLSRTLRLKDFGPKERFAASDLNVYYDVKHPLWHKRPDWFLVVGVPRLYEGKDLRRSYVIWQERKSPSIVIEFLSPSTEQEDLGRFYQPQDQLTEGGAIEASPPSDAPPDKVTVYERYLGVAHYLVYNRYAQKLRYFKLHQGQFEEQPLRSSNPLVWFDDLEIGLGIWQGEFEGVEGAWLRWCDAVGQWLLTDTEQERQAKEQERQAKEQERQAKEAAQQRAARLEQRLRELGINPEEV